MQRVRIVLLLVLIACLVVVVSTQAMSSPNYALDWMALLSGGGGDASSAHHAVSVTVGQSVIGSASSAHYAGTLGYWYEIAGERLVYLPVAIR